MAKRFHFHLDPVLRYRQILENERKKEFAIANRAWEEERLHRTEMEEERQKTQEEIRALYAAKTKFQEILETYRYVNALDVRLAYLERRLAELDRVREEKREALVKARRDRRALEILREHRKEEHDAQNAAEEQKILDELAIRAARRRRSTETESSSS